MTLFYGKMKAYTVIIGVIIVIAAVLNLVTSYKTETFGLILGLSFSYVNLWTIYRKTIIVGETAEKSKHPSLFSTFIASFGFVIRTAIAVAAIWLALRRPELFNLVSVISGLALVYIIILIDVISQSIRKR